jgi:lipoprotein-releasing system permease protein
LPSPSRRRALIGLRYTRAKRRNHFISFISLISMLGIALGVAALIVVLSVMNGFQKELRTRILGVASHVQITGADGELSDWQQVAEQAAKHPEVRRRRPTSQPQGMLSFDQTVRGALVRGVLPDAEDGWPISTPHAQTAASTSLQPGEFGIVLGASWRARCACSPATR